MLWGENIDSRSCLFVGLKRTYSLTPLRFSLLNALRSAYFIDLCLGSLGSLIWKRDTATAPASQVV